FDPRRAGRVPLQLAVGSWKIETRQRTVQLTQELSKTGQQLGGLRSGFSQGAPRNITKHPYLAPHATGFDPLDRALVDRALYSGDPQTGGGPGKVLKRPPLQINQLRFALRMHDLQYELLTGGRGEMKIAVVFSRKWTGSGVHTIQIGGDSDGEVRSEAGWQ